MEITKYAEKLHDVWSDVIDASANGTVFHGHKFLGYHPPGRFQWHHLVFGNPDAPDAILPAAVDINEQQRRTLRSPIGASLGGLVVKPRLGLARSLEIIRSLVAYARNQSFTGISLATVPAIYWSIRDDTLEVALRDAGFECMVQLAHHVDLQSLPWPDVMQGIPPNRRPAFRKALRQGLEFHLAETSGEIAEFHEVLVANKQTHGAVPVHTAEEIVLLKQRLGTQLQIFCAKKGGHIAAGVYCVAANNLTCYTQYIADHPVYRHLDPTRFVLFEMLKELRKQGFRYLDLGPSTALPIEKPTLAFFKESLGAVGGERRQWTRMLSN